MVRVYLSKKRNNAVFSPADRKSSEELYQVKDFHRQGEREQGSYMRQKSMLFIARSLPFRGRQG